MGIESFKPIVSKTNFLKNSEFINRPSNFIIEIILNLKIQKPKDSKFILRYIGFL